MVEILLLSTLLAAEYRTPAGTEPPSRRPGVTSILPGGRMIDPAGRQIATGPGPFGVAISPSGKRIVSSDGGPYRYSLTVVENDDGQWRTRTILAKKPDNEKENEDDLRSVFQGVAFDTERDLYASEGNSGRILLLDPTTGKRRATFNLNQGGYRDSYSGDLAIDRGRGLLYVLDQANFRMAVFDIRRKQLIGSVRVGRLPFAIALSPDGRRAYVANAGMFEYRPIPNVDKYRAHEAGLPFPAFGFASSDSLHGVERTNASGQTIQVPALGDPNTPESNSLAVVNTNLPTRPFVEKFIPTGVPHGRASAGGSGPAGVTATASKIYVSNGNQDSISVIDATSLEREPDILLRIPGLESYRGILPIGLAIDEGRGWLLVAEAGINAVGVIDFVTRRVLGHIPAAWFPTRMAVRDGVAYVVNAKGFGTGPNATQFAPVDRTTQHENRRGALISFSLPSAKDLQQQTKHVFDLNGFNPRNEDAIPLPAAIKRVVVIVKKNRSFDEVFGDIEHASNGSVRSAPELARWGRKGVVKNAPGELRQRLNTKFVNVTPNHHAIADRWSISDNFYADSEVSVDGQHWLSGSYPNAWTESSLVAAAGGDKDFRFPTTAPGRFSFVAERASVHPEGITESGTIWHHLEKHNVSFYNFGDGMDLAGADEGINLKPTGARYLTNVAMLDPLFRNTSRIYPTFNTNIPDQYRADQFIKEAGAMKELPRFLYIHLPNDHGAKARPADGYPFEASFVADNDYALGRILEFLSSRPEWKETALFITEDNATGGVDHVDSHRTVLMVAGPYAKKNFVSHVNTSFPGMLKTIFRLLGVPPLNLYDATAAGLADCFTDQPDFTPLKALPPSKQIFDPAEVKEPSR